MEFLFKDYHATAEKLYKAGYILCNMVYSPNEYELFSIKRDKVVIEYLSVAQVEQLAEILWTSKGA